MSYQVPVCLQLNINSVTAPPVFQVASINGNNVYQAEFTLLYPQIYHDINGNQLQYDVLNILIGNWIAGTEGGVSWKISNIVNVDEGTQTITLQLEDIGNFNAQIDSAGFNGYPQSGSNYIYFTVSSDGLPVFSPLYNLYADSLLPQLPSDIISIFNNRNPARQNVNIYQVGNTFLLNDPILDWFDLYYNKMLPELLKMKERYFSEFNLLKKVYNFTKCKI